MTKAIQIVKKLSENVAITPVSAVIDSNITEAELENAFEFYGMVDKANHFWIGDTANAESANYPKGYPQIVAKKTGFTDKTIIDDKYIANSVRSSVRTDDLSHTHHKLVAPFEEEKQKEWLTSASAGKWTVSRLKKEIADKKNQGLIDAFNEVPEDERYNIFQADIRTVELDEQFDFIITDPPYPKEYLPLLETLAIRAKEWLKPSGLLVAMCAHYWLPQVLEMMTRHLDYYWICSYLVPGASGSNIHKKVNPNWKPILIFGSSDYNGKIFSDVFKSEQRDKDFHEWGQSVSGMSSIIGQICKPTQTILDPFLGAGTTGISALENHCLFTGFDIDGNEVKKSLMRMSEL